MNTPFEFRIVALEGKKPIEEEKQFYVECRLYHGETLLTEVQSTPRKLPSVPLFLYSIQLPIAIKDIPKASRLCFEVYEETAKGNDELVGWNIIQLIDHKLEFISGVKNLSLWTTEQVNYVHAAVEPPDPIYTLVLEFPRYDKPVMFFDLPTSFSAPKKMMEPTTEEKWIINQVCKKDPMYVITEEEKALFWKYREYLSENIPLSLKNLLLAVPFEDSDMVKEFHKILSHWKELEPHAALGLLDWKFADEKVRSFAVRCLHSLSHAEVKDLMLQLVQVVKCEPYHDSSLARFLLHRALADKGNVGHVFFWHLRGEIVVPQYSDRFAFLAETYLRCCGEHRGELVKQVEMVSKLKRIAVAVQKVPLGKRNQLLRKQLQATHFKSDVRLPSNSKYSVQSLVVESCKAKDSFTVNFFKFPHNNNNKKLILYIIGTSLVSI